MVYPISILLSALLITTVTCVLEIPLYVKVRRRDDLYSNSAVSLTHQAAEKAYAKGPRRGIPGAFMDYHFTDEYYVVRDFKLGNPPRTFEMSVFSHTYRSTVFDRGFTQLDCPLIRNYTFIRPKTYDPNRSTTARRQPGAENFGVPEIDSIGNFLCRDYSLLTNLVWAVGYKVSDDIKINGFLSKSTNFTVIGELHVTLDNQWDSDGIIGLTRTDGVFGVSESTIRTLAMNAGGSPEVSLRFTRLSGPVTTPTVAGVMTLGGRSSENCAKWVEMLDCPLSEDGCDLVNWNVRIRRFKAGSFINDSVTEGLPEVGSSYIQAPLNHFNAIVKEVGAVADKTGKYVVDCAKVASLPPLEFDLAKADLSGMQLFVEAKDYARNIVPRNDGNCTLQIIPNDNGFYWILGTTATKDFCWSFNYDTNKLSLAKNTANV